MTIAYLLKRGQFNLDGNYSFLPSLSKFPASLKFSWENISRKGIRESFARFCRQGICPMFFQQVVPHSCFDFCHVRELIYAAVRIWFVVVVVLCCLCGASRSDFESVEDTRDFRFPLLASLSQPMRNETNQTQS